MIVLKSRYELRETLGAGGEGRVVKALDRQHDRLVALKIRGLRDGHTREEMLAEARILLAVPPHPALPLVREDFFDGDDYVVAMDWVEGTDLALLLRDRGGPGLAPSSVLAYLAQAAEALTHLHSQDPPVIHGDVKPANLILAKGGAVKLVDFGLSSAPYVTRSRAGTPGFRAPELTTGAIPSRASDIYSLAATAFALLTGAPPSGVLPSWDGFDPIQAQHMEEAIRVGLATDPARRPATPGEFVERLRAGWGATLPTGVMTFCLTDIEGSTALWEAEPQAMAEALVRHDALIADVMEAHEGRFLKSMGEGDSTVSVFVSATQALQAAVATERAIAAEPWPAGTRIVVRLALHTGEAECRGADYFGPTLNLAARLRGQAAGGEVLLSSATAGLVAGHLPADCELVDLGPHRLRGFGDPQSIHAIKAPGLRTPLPAGECPYRGLLSFEPGDRGVFFGREAVVEEVLGRLVPGRLLAVIGASGSGKSSVLRAGVAGAVLAEEVPGLVKARIITPGPEPPLDIGDDPFEVLLVDQFEELYTLCDDPGRRAAFIDRLLAARSAVAIGVRADLYGELSDHANLARAVATNQILLGAMTGAELERAITEPARVAGLRLEPGLADLILRDVAREPGVLPLLSHALRVTWEHRDGRTLTLDGYRGSGGVASAIAQTADAIVASVPEDRQTLMRSMFLRMTETGEGIEDTRRRVAVEELVPQSTSPAEVQALLHRLADARLVTLREGTAEVAHEVLIREWPTLRGWLEEDRAGMRVHRELGNAARLWDAGGREPGDLYRGTRLGAGVDWAQDHPDALNATERAFLDAAIAESERERRGQLRANRRLRALLAGAAVLLAAAAVAGVLALRESDNARDSARNARDSARTADAQRLGAQALLDDRLDRGLLLAQAGRTLDDSAATRTNLLSALQRNPATLAAMQAPGPVLRMAVSPDEQLIAAAGETSGTVALIDLRSRRPRAPLETDFPGVFSLDFSPDGRMLAVGGGDGGQDIVRVFDVATGRSLPEIRVPLTFRGGPENSFLLTDARFSADGRIIVTTQIVLAADRGLPGKHPPVVTRFDVRTGSRLGDGAPVGRDEVDALAPVVPTQRGILVFTAAHDNETYVVDAATRRVLRRFETGAFEVGLSSDGRTAALGGQDGSVSILDLRTGEHRTFSGRHEGPVQKLAFSTDGHILATTGDDGRILVWDVRRGEVRETLTGHSGRVTGLRFSSDGRALYSTGFDSRIIVWDIAGDRRLAQSFRGGTRIVDSFPGTGPIGLIPPPLTVSPDGRWVAMGLKGGGVRINDARTLRPVREFSGIGGRVAAAVEFSPDGETIAVTGSGGSVELRDPVSGERLRPPVPGLEKDALALAFSPDGTQLAVVDFGGALRVLDLESGRVRRVQLPSFGNHLSFSPDGDLLAIALEGQGTELRDSGSLEVVAQLRSDTDDDADRWVGFSPDGRLLAVASFKGRTQLWDVATRRRDGPPLTGHEGGVVNAVFAPDGQTLATSGTDGAVNLWDVASRRAIGSIRMRQGWVGVRFTPDSRQLFLLHDSGDALRWDVDPESWSERACNVAGRELTRDEWDEFVPQQDYRRVCGGF